MPWLTGRAWFGKAWCLWSWWCQCCSWTSHSHKLHWYAIPTPAASPQPQSSQAQDLSLWPVCKYKVYNLLKCICWLLTLFNTTVNMFTLFFTCCSGVVEACVEEVSHCTVLCRSSQSATCSTGCWNSTWTTLHFIGWLVRVTGILEQKVTVTSLEQPAWRCPTWREKNTFLITNLTVKKKEHPQPQVTTIKAAEICGVCVSFCLSGPLMKGGWVPFTWLCSRICGL